MSGGGFQVGVNVQPAPAVAGDFASSNPRYSVLAGPGGLVAGSSGVTIGAFAWLSSSSIDQDSAPTIVNNFGSGPVGGFVHREQQGLITTFLSDATMSIPSGFPLTLMSGGDYWVKNSGATEAVPGQYAYANLANGLASFAAANSASTASGSSSSVAASTFSVTGSISGNVLTVTNVTSGTLVNGATISGTNVATGTQIVLQLSGTTGGVGTYAVSIPEQTVASTTVSGTYGTLTIGGTVTGTIALGGLLSGTGVAANTTISQFLTGTGGAGTYAVNNNTVVGATSIAVTTNVQTKWIAMSSAAPGELVKISSQPLG
jgi:hypothetical protein